MADHERAVFTAKVHTVPFAEPERITVFAGLQLLHPRAVAVWLKTIFPDIPEGVVVDIALVVFATDRSTCRYRTVNEDRRHADTRGTMIEMIPYPPFIVTEESFAGIRDMPSGFAF